MVDRSSSYLYALGDNRIGQAGVGGEELLTNPVKVTHFDPSELRRIIANATQTFAILFNGTVLTSGENDNGELCRPGKRSIFQRVDMLETFKIIDVAAGENFFHLLCQNGQLLSYGKNDMGQLGTGNRDAKEKPRLNPNIKDPLIQIACGLHHTVALTKTGQVVTWGGNRRGQLGDGQLTSSIHPIPLLPLRHRPVIAIACGEYHSMAMTSGGNVYSWGANDHGQLGHGDTTARLRPELIRSLRSNKTIHIACGRQHSLFITYNHLLFATGANTHGQCGQELAFRQVLSPTVVEYFREKRTSNISCGALHSFVTASTFSQPDKYKLYVMGSNACGQLGLTSPQSTDYPQLSPIFDGNVLETVFTSSLSLTSYILTAQSEDTLNNIYSTSTNNPMDRNMFAQKQQLRVKPLPSITSEDILSLFQRLPSQPHHLQPPVQRAVTDQLVLEIREKISAAFSSISVLNASFAHSSASTMSKYTTSSNSSTSTNNNALNVDLYDVRRAYEAILAVESSYPSIVVTLGRTLVHICDELKQCPFDDVETLSVFFILLENPLLLRIAEYHIVLEKLVTSILSLPKSLRLELFKKMKYYPSEFFGRVVSVLMHFLSFILSEKIVGLDSTPVLLVLETLYHCNLESGQEDLESTASILPYQCFHHSTLPKVIPLLKEWQRYQESRAQQLSQVVNFWQYPFLMDESWKYRVLQLQYEQQRQAYVHVLNMRYDVSSVLRHLVASHLHSAAYHTSTSTSTSSSTGDDNSATVGGSNTNNTHTSSNSNSTNSNSNSNSTSNNSSNNNGHNAAVSVTERLSAQLQAYLPAQMKAVVSERLLTSSVSNTSNNNPNDINNTNTNTNTSASGNGSGSGSSHNNSQSTADATSSSSSSSSSSNSSSSNSNHTTTQQIVRSFSVSSLYFHVSVRRSHLLMDVRHVLSQTLQSDPDVLFLPIKVEFVGELGEDVGGLTKELLTLTIQQLMQDSGAFALSSSGQVFWFTRHNKINSDNSNKIDNNSNSSGKETLISWEEMLGLVQSLAIYHGVHVDVPLPRSMYKLLKQRQLTLSDLWAADRELAQGLKMLLQYPEGLTSIEDAFGATFVASANPLLDLDMNNNNTTTNNSNSTETSDRTNGTVDSTTPNADTPNADSDNINTFTTHNKNDNIATTAKASSDVAAKKVPMLVPLVNQGDAKAVTRGNRADFVRRFVTHSLWDSCATAIDQYSAGVKRLVGSEIWMLCSHEELETLVAGVALTESLSVMRAVTRYAGEHFSDHHPVIQWFWEIVGAFSLLQKKLFLLFVTGSERAPIGGLSRLTITMQSTEQDRQSLPSSRTCFNLLFLSRHYESKENLCEKLCLAMEHSQGFGLV